MAISSASGSLKKSAKSVRGDQGMKSKTPSGPRDEVVKRGGTRVYARRDSRGRFTEMTSEGRSLSRDRRQRAKHKKPRRQGDRGD